jgi:DNA-binding protein HU-beta
MAKNKQSLPTVATSSIIAEVSARFEQLPKKITKQVIASFLETIENNVADGRKVRIDKVGILTVKDRAARKGRNPQTGDEIKIPASKKISFRVAKSLKERVSTVKKVAKKK